MEPETRPTKKIPERIALQKGGSAAAICGRKVAMFASIDKREYLTIDGKAVKVRNTVLTIPASRNYQEVQYLVTNPTNRGSEVTLVLIES